MLERFLRRFDPARAPGTVDETAAGVIARLGGLTFGGGLYRIHDPSSADAANRLVADAFPDFGNRHSCFGFDWLGRQFATDAARGSADDPEVLMFEPGTAQALEIPAPFSPFPRSGAGRLLGGRVGRRVLRAMAGCWRCGAGGLQLTTALAAAAATGSNVGELCGERLRGVVSGTRESEAPAWSDLPGLQARSATSARTSSAVHERSLT